jgi:hypothetical protein
MGSAQMPVRSVVGSSGGSSTAGDVNMSYTVGESVITTLTAGNMTLTQGFQQPDELDEISAVNEFGSRFYAISVFPNPFKDEVVIDIKGVDNPGEMLVQILDPSGKLFYSAQLQFPCVINGRYFPPGAYIAILKDRKGIIQGTKKLVKQD